MKDANTSILETIEATEAITAAGKNNLLAIAARTLDPQVPNSKRGISQALGLHPGLIIAILVSSDHAGDTQSRRELGRMLFSRLRLQARPPRLTPDGRRQLIGWCLKQMRPLAELLDGLLDDALALVPLKHPSAGSLQEVQDRARRLQRSQVVGIKQGQKDRLGISDRDRCQRHAGQAICALVQGLREGFSSSAATITVIGEVASALALHLGYQQAGGFCLELAAQLEDLPETSCQRSTGNGN